MSDQKSKAKRAGRACGGVTDVKSRGTPDAVADVRKRSPFQVVVSVLLMLCIMTTMVVIFLFSAESKEASGGRSDGVTEWIASVIFVDYDDLTPAERETLLSMMGHPVRKLAHMTEYAFLAVLCGAYYTLNGKRQGFMRWVIPAGFCLLYAITDEVHQIFSSRGPAVRDVLIDLSGAILGLCVLYGIIGLVRLCVLRHKARRNRRKTDARPDRRRKRFKKGKVRP